MAPTFQPLAKLDTSRFRSVIVQSEVLLLNSNEHCVKSDKRDNLCNSSPLKLLLYMSKFMKISKETCKFDESSLISFNET